LPSFWPAARALTAQIRADLSKQSKQSKQIWGA